MDNNKFTEKSLTAIAEAESMARNNSNPELASEHLLFSLLSQENGLIPQIIKKITDLEGMLQAVKGKLDKLSKVIGNEQIYMSNELSFVLNEAEKQANSMKDEYISVEHLMLGLIIKAKSLSDIFKKYEISKEAFLKELMAVRGN